MNDKGKLKQSKERITWLELILDWQKKTSWESIIWADMVASPFILAIDRPKQEKIHTF